MDILHFEDLGDTSVVSKCSLGVNLVIDNFFACSFFKEPSLVESLINYNLT